VESRKKSAVWLIATVCRRQKNAAWRKAELEPARIECGPANAREKDSKILLPVAQHIS
jgi:hypothetical protein